ncbi:MAG TPA: acyltransferase [Asticcacaulis sp.]|nr:acyltransferase [Asticcacaulis sp.]
MFKLDKSMPTPADTVANRHVSRIDWVDLARGIGILLVILGHASGGIVDSPAGARAPEAHIVYLSIYIFHMALFFFLAGLFVAARLKANAESFLLNTGTRLARAYFTWAAIQFTVIYLMGSALNHPADGPYLPQLVAILWKPVSQFWFLYVLVFMQLLAFLIVPRMGATGFFVITAAVTASYHLFNLDDLFNWPTFNQFAIYFVWFGAGTAVGPYVPRLKFLQPAKPFYALVALALLAGFFYLAYHYFDGAQPGGLISLSTDRLYRVANHPIFLTAAAAGTAMVVLASCTGLIPARGFVDYIGRHSMAIFLTHVLFIAGTRIVVLKLAPNIEPMLLMVCVAGAGLAGSLLFLEAAKRLKVARTLALV